ncbi:hypothetical protein MRB53_040978 [Persea americana]|nr:hypothetical protein MRB53_040978 [Persea americana]
MVPETVVPMRIKISPYGRETHFALRQGRRLTILELNLDRLTLTFHKKPTLCTSQLVVLEVYRSLEKYPGSACAHRECSRRTDIIGCLFRYHVALGPVSVDLRSARSSCSGTGYASLAVSQALDETALP